MSDKVLVNPKDIRYTKSDMKKYTKKKILELLKNISDNENIELEYLLSKYTKQKKKQSKPLLMEMKVIDGNEYYYQDKKNSSVYDINSKVVGVFDGKKIKLK
jgi:hypothetical protein